MPLWRNGRRGRLKISFPYGSAGSSPVRGTNMVIKITKITFHRKVLNRQPQLDIYYIKDGTPGLQRIKNEHEILLLLYHSIVPLLNKEQTLEDIKCKLISMS